MKTNPLTPMSSPFLADHVRGCAVILQVPLINGTKLSEYENRVLRSIIERCNALATVVEARKSER